MPLEDIRILANSGGLDSVVSHRESLEAHARKLKGAIARDQQVLDQLTRYLAQPERSMPAMQTPERIYYPSLRIMGMS
ncbi:hypothetical protein D3C73_1611470 [compost metagenome]